MRGDDAVSHAEAGGDLSGPTSGMGFRLPERGEHGAFP
jgi:hypothetical protein